MTHEFMKIPGKLEAHELALLFTLIGYPNKYDPLLKPTEAILGRNHLLDLMSKDGTFSNQEIDDLKGKPLGIIRHKAEQ